MRLCFQSGLGVVSITNDGSSHSETVGGDEYQRKRNPLGCIFIAALASYEQTKTSLDSVFYTMLNKFGYKETIDRLNKYLATGNENLITRTNDARTIIKSISMNHIQRYLNDTINGISSTPSPKPIQKVERINTGFDGYSDILKINQLDSETIATINPSTDSLVVFDEDIDINESSKYLGLLYQTMPQANKLQKEYYSTQMGKIKMKEKEDGFMNETELDDDVVIYPFLNNR